MAASAIAIPTFGSGRALLATDLTDGVHTLQVTTDAPDSAIAIWGFASTKYVIGTVEADGIHTLCVSTDSPDSGIAVWGWGAEKYVLGTVESAGVYVMCVTTDSPDNAIAMPGFGNGVVILATVESGGVHVPVVSDAESGDAPFALWEWGNEKTVLAADTSGSGPAVIPLVLGLGPAYDPDAAAYFAASGVNSEPYLAAINQFVLDLKAASIWTKFDRLWLFANQDATAALTCLKSLEVAAAMNAPSFTAGQGYTGNGSDSYVDTNFVPSTDGVQYTQNSGMLTVYNGTNSNFRFFDMGASSTGTRDASICAKNWATGETCGSVNCSLGMFVADATSLGLYMASRTGASAQAIYKNGTSIKTDTTAATNTPTVSILVGAFNSNGTPSSFNDRLHSLAGMGAGFNSTEAAAFDTCVDTLKTAIGF